MTRIQILMVIGFVGGIFVAAILATRWLMLRSRTSQRWAELSRSRDQIAGDEAVAEALRESRWWLARWLFLAGYRQPRADVVFIVTTCCCIVTGLSIAMGMQISGLQAQMERTVVLVPGGVGETFLPVVWVAPWMLMIMLSCVPWLIVRKSRRERVELVEQDLPLALELSFVADEVAAPHWNFRRQLALNLRDDGNEIALGRVRGNHDAAHGVFATDGVRPLAFEHLRDHGKRHATAGRRVDEQFAQPIRVGARRIGKTHHKIEGARALKHLANHAAVESGFKSHR